MSGSWACWFWTLVGAGCLGWGVKGMVLGSVMDEKRREVERLKSKVTMLTNQPPEVRTVEKRVEVPVDRVVVKHVEVPVEKIIEKRVEVPIEKTVEKIVDRPVDNQEYLVRIKALEGEVAMIAGLLPQIAQFQTVASQVGGRSVEGRVVVPVDNPEHLARIKALEGEVAVIADLRSQMAELRDLLLQVGEKVAKKPPETPVEQHMETPPAQVSERAVECNQASVSEQTAEREADEASPDNLKHIRGVGPALERFLNKRGVFWFRQVATWSHADIDKFEFLLPNFGGRIQREHWVRSAQVEHYKKYQEWLGDGEPPRESLDLPGQVTEIQAVSLQTEVKVAETFTEEIVLKNRAVVDETISEPAGALDQASVAESVDEGEADEASPDDLKHIRGIGPALERFLHKRGVFWFRQVATWSPADIDKFEFLLPNFGGRIQRENWMRSAQVEHYKKYQEWLGDGEPPRESLDLPRQMADLQAASPQAENQSIEMMGIETPMEQNGVVPTAQVNEHALDRDHAGAQVDGGQAVGESSDDLKRIYGVGPGLERFLHKRGVFWFSQVATWKQTDIEKFEFLLPNFEGRIQRENWVRSAKVEHYKKYKQWLGDDQPPSTTPETH